MVRKMRSEFVRDQVSFDDVVITEVKMKVKVRCEIRGTAGYRGDVNIVNLDGDIVNGGCNGDVLSDVVGGRT